MWIEGAGVIAAKRYRFRDRFTTTYSFDAAEYFAPADDMPEYDDDNNEYYGTVTRPEGQR